MERYTNGMKHKQIVTQTTVELVEAFARHDHAGKIDEIVEKAIEKAITEELQWMKDADPHNIEENQLITENRCQEYGMRRHNLMTCNFRGTMQPSDDGWWVPFEDAKRAIEAASLKRS